MVRPEGLAGWYRMAASTDEAGNVTGRGILFQGSRPDDFGAFMTSWMKRKITPPLRWRACRFGDEPPTYPDRDGLPIDDGFSGQIGLTEEPLSLWSPRSDYRYPACS